MNKGDCFFLKRDDGGTLYKLIEVFDDGYKAVYISFGPEHIQSARYEAEFEDMIPQEAILLPGDIYDSINKKIEVFVNEIYQYLGQLPVVADFELLPGNSYTDGEYIYILTKLEEERWHYRLFRIEEENICTHWGGNARVDGFKERVIPISDECLDVVLDRFIRFEGEILDSLK